MGNTDSDCKLFQPFFSLFERVALEYSCQFRLFFSTSLPIFQRFHLKENLFCPGFLATISIQIRGSNFFDKFLLQIISRYRS